MTTVKEILSANRESVISSIKWTCKIWKSEDVKSKMVEFLAYAEENASVEALSTSKKVKTDLKNLVASMEMAFTKKRNLEIYGMERPRLADIMGRIAEREEEAGNCFNQITSSWEKKSYKNQIFH